MADFFSSMHGLGITGILGIRFGDDCDEEDEELFKAMIMLILIQRWRESCWGGLDSLFQERVAEELILRACIRPLLRLDLLQIHFISLRKKGKTENFALIIFGIVLIFIRVLNMNSQKVIRMILNKLMRRKSFLFGYLC